MNIPNIDITHRSPAIDLRIERVRWTTEDTPRFHPHSHENIEINFLERGSVTYLHSNRIQSIAGGQTGVFWAGYPHRIFAGDPEVSLWWITIPMRDFFSWKFSQAFTRRLISGDLVLGRGASSALDLAMIRRWSEEQTNASLRPVILLELQALLKRLEAHMAPRVRSDPRSVAQTLGFLHPASVKMASYITENFREPLGLESIATVAKLNPSYAARLFKKNFGHSIGDFIREVRISHAINLLQTSSGKVLDIAYESGFQSASRFYEAFGKVTGSRPGDFRFLTDSG